MDEMKVTQDDRYLHHDGKPVLFVWGFFSDRFGPALAHRIIDFFKADAPVRRHAGRRLPVALADREGRRVGQGVPPVRRHQPVERRQR